MEFYLNDQFTGRVDVDTRLLEKPYSRPMQMQMLTETYNWGTPYPTKEQLLDDTINTSYYDWVRSYYLADVNEDVRQELEVEGVIENIFEESVLVKKTQVVRNQLKYSYVYQSDEDCIMHVVISKNENPITSKKVNVKAGYGHIVDSIAMNTASDWDDCSIQLKMMDSEDSLMVSQSVLLEIK